MNKETFSELVLQSTDSMYRCAKGILRQDSDCEDAVQEAIALAFAHLPSLKRDEYAKTWLIRILIRECTRILRQQKRTAALEDQAEQGYTPRSYYDLYQALESLDEKYRITVVLYYIEGFSISETADILGTTQGTVKSRLSRARKQLRQLLEQKEEFA